ncbi:MAG: hypothetical protein IT428_05795 [Planctomycetaceae bacterium]|nr:hypothetical protein [Planctomycetaceae bacterium]
MTSLPATRSILLTGAFKRTGHRSATHGCSISELVRRERLGLSENNDDVIIVFLLPPERPYLTIEAKATDPQKGEIQFLKTKEKAKEILPSFSTAQGFAIARVPFTARIAVEVRVNTDHPQFLAINPEKNADSLTSEICVNIYPAANPDEGGAMQTLELKIAPATPAPPHEGLVAFDLGNTSSTMVRMPVIDPLGRHPVDRIDLVRIRRLGTPGPVPTVLRLSQYSAPRVPGEFSTGECEIPSPGQARDGSQTAWELHGIKRQLSDPANEDPKVIVNGHVIEIPKSEPAQLFCSETFLGFFRHQQSYPQELAITCPTTFSQAEVGALKEAVYQGWRRARGAREQVVNEANRERYEEGFRKLLGEGSVIDEASAAAFYFLFKDFVTADGRVPALRYVYPDGINILLYDCGGGTTDIALIRASFPNESEILRIDVLGRAGHRKFGGDSITVAFYRLLKAKLAAAVDKDTVEFPDDPAELREYFLDPQRKQAIDAIVPTIFEHLDDLQNFEARDRRRATLFLWDWAEDYKKALATAEEDDTPDPPELVAGTDLTWFAERIRKASGGPGLTGQQLQNHARNCGITREEVNALIDDDIRKSIEYANHLIEAHSAPGTARHAQAEAKEKELRRSPADVDWVYVVGNASRYPRIRELMKDSAAGLRVRFLSDRLADVPPALLKDSVAKGAVLALAVDRVNFGVTVQFDKEFMNRLPFAVTSFYDLGLESDDKLYTENTPYDQLQEQRIRMTADLRKQMEATIKKQKEKQKSPGADHGLTLQLARKWPGDTEPEPYLNFRLQHVPKADLLLGFDKSGTRQFYVCEDSSGKNDRGEKVFGQLSQPPLYRAPPQVGDL